jgi:hypothetical protein
MLRYRAVLVSALSATIMPVFAAYATDSLPVTQPDGAVTLQQLFRPASSQSLSAPGIVSETRAAGSIVGTGAAVSFSRPSDRRYGLVGGAASTTLKLSPTIYAPKTGWQLSGRVGPVRWMTPLEGEGETAVRFGGRVPGQPRMPGLGLFNVGIHYTFE